jgi:hypothetical protein
MKDPNNRLKDGKSIRKHQFFAGIDWKKMLKKRIAPPYVPVLKSDADTAHFDLEELKDNLDYTLEET